VSNNSVRQEIYVAHTGSILVEDQKAKSGKGGLPMAMTITKFEVHNDNVVTIHLTELPRDARTDNTTVYIGGSPQNEPEMVSPTQQMIQFQPVALTHHHGTISVTIQRDSGVQATATSAAIYDSRGPTEDEGSLNPIVTSFAPPKLSPGAPISLRGSRMNLMDTVWLGANKIPGKPRTTPTTAQFTVPPGLNPGHYNIGFKGPNMAAKKTTGFIVEIE
jgi:hypothetical protein